MVQKIKLLPAYKSLKALVVGLTLLSLLALPLLAQSSAKKPISKQGLLSAVKINGLSTAELIRRVQQRGVDFELTPEVESEFQQVGARPELLAAVRGNFRPVANTTASSNPAPRSNTAPRRSAPANVPAGAPLSKNEVITLLQSGVPVERVEQFVEVRGVNFAVTPQIAREISAAGGNRALIGAITERSVNTTASGSDSRRAAPVSNTLDYDDLTDQATDAIKDEDHDRAIRLLQQAISMDTTQPTAYALLGIAQLYGKQNVNAAEQAMRATVERGGGAVFRVYHDHDGFFKTYCQGSFFVTKGGMTFKADDGQHTFEANDPDVREVKLNGFVGAEYGAFHVKVAQGSGKPKNYNFAPATQKSFESNMIISLIQGFK